MCFDCKEYRYLNMLIIKYESVKVSQNLYDIV